MEMPLNEGHGEVAALDGFDFDLQLFAEDVTPDAGGESGIDTDTGDLDVDESDGSNITIGDDNTDEPGTVDQDDEQTPESVKKQSADADRAFAEMRKQKEAAERTAQQAKADIQVQRDAEFAKRFGNSHGIYTEAQYWQAMDRQKEQAETQRKQQMEQLPKQVYEQAIADGYDPKVAGLMAKDAEKDLKLQQMEQRMAEKDSLEKQKEVEAQKDARAKEILTDHEKLAKEFGDIVPDLASLDNATKEKLRKGYSLYDAWVTSNQAAVREHERNAGTAKALKNVNSKKHLQSEKSGAGDFGTNVELSPEQLRVWRAMGYSDKEARKRAAKYQKKGK